MALIQKYTTLAASINSICNWRSSVSNKMPGNDLWTHYDLSMSTFTERIPWLNLPANHWKSKWQAQQQLEAASLQTLEGQRKSHLFLCSTSDLQQLHRIVCWGDPVWQYRSWLDLKGHIPQGGRESFGKQTNTQLSKVKGGWWLATINL